MLKAIILDLNVNDFSEVVFNVKEKYKNEKLYVFGPHKYLTNINGIKESVNLYIKINYIDNKKIIIVVSIHEAEYKISYKFNKER